jgi:RNA polymerase sigma-70 factor (ECF subfamily)
VTDNTERQLEDPERLCVLNAQAGDVDAFSELVERYSGRIFSACFSFLGNRQDAEDCVQESFIKAWRAIGDYNFMASFYTWLYRIAVNACLDYRRKTSRQQTLSLDETIETDDSQVVFQIADDEPLPDMLAETKELRTLIREEISALPPMMRQIIVLRDLEGLSYHELADLLDLSEGTVKSRLSRARQQLMQRISKREKNHGTIARLPASNK